jgi:hypothetical protein
MSLALQRLVRARLGNPEFPLTTPFSPGPGLYTSIPLYSVLGPLPISLGVNTTDQSIVVETDALDGIIDGGTQL